MLPQYPFDEQQLPYVEFRHVELASEFEPQLPSVLIEAIVNEHFLRNGYGREFKEPRVEPKERAGHNKSYGFERYRFFSLEVIKPTTEVTLYCLGS